VSCVNKNMDVATGKGLLRLHEVQLPGGKRMTAQAFLNAHHVNGVKLGNCSMRCSTSCIHIVVQLERKLDYLVTERGTELN